MRSTQVRIGSVVTIGRQATAYGFAEGHALWGEVVLHPGDRVRITSLLPDRTPRDWKDVIYAALVDRPMPACAYLSLSWDMLDLTDGMLIRSPPRPA